MPGGVFNKGIVRGYARVVGLDEDAWVGRFMAAYQDSGQLKDDDANWIEFAENVVKNRKTEAERPDMRLRWVGVILLLLLVAGLGWFVFSFVQHKVSSAQRERRRGPGSAAKLLRSTRTVSLSIRCKSSTVERRFRAFSRWDETALPGERMSR